MQIITRAEARAQGLEFYFTGRPCSRGGIAPRRVASPQCTCPACREVLQARSRAWRKANPDLQRQATRRWHERNPEKSTAWAQRNAQKKAQRRRTDTVYAEKQRTRLRELNRRLYHEKYGKDEEYTLRIKASTADQKVKRRRASQAVTLTPVEQQQVRAIYRLRYIISRETGVEHHVDHHIPLSKGGLHHPSNLWVLPAAENLRKGARLPALA